MLYLERLYREKMIAHAKEEAPNECCGILAGKEGRVTRLYRALNAEKSPLRYSIDPKDLFRIYREVDGAGWELLGIYHSHTHSEAYPSATDIELAFWPDSLYLIVSLKDEEPVIKAFKIVDGKVTEEKIELMGTKERSQR